MKRVCTKCQETKDIDDFPPDKRASDGKQARCRHCINTWMKQHARSNPAWQMIRRAKARARKKEIPFNLDVSDILPLPDTCPVFGMPLRASEFPQDPWAYSLDRIRNSGGYVRGNVAVMSYHANRLKNNGTAEEHETIARWMRQNTGA